jgi:hypothetical protein
MPGRKGIMDYLPKTGRLERNLKSVSVSAIPKSETVQTIELTKMPDGSIQESDEHIRAQKERKVLALQERYGAIDETQITWVKIKKDPATPA